MTNADKKTSPHTESEAEKEVPGHQQSQDNTSEQFKYVEDDDEIDSSSKSGWEDFDVRDLFPPPQKTQQLFLMAPFSFLMMI